jgi:hypothetical protein
VASEVLLLPRKIVKAISNGHPETLSPIHPFLINSYDRCKSEPANSGDGLWQPGFLKRDFLEKYPSGDISRDNGMRPLSNRKGLVNSAEDRCRSSIRNGVMIPIKSYSLCSNTHGVTYYCKKDGSQSGRDRTASTLLKGEESTPRNHHEDWSGREIDQAQSDYHCGIIFPKLSNAP